MRAGIFILSILISLNAKGESAAVPTHPPAVRPAPQVAPLKQTAKPQKPPSQTKFYSPTKQVTHRKSFISFNLTPSFNLYQQTDFQDVKTTSLVGKISFIQLLLPSRWSFNASGHFTLFSIKSDPVDLSIRYLGGHLGFAYALPWPEKPWQITLSAGGFLETTLTNDDFGYVNIYGPEAGTSLKYSFQGGHALRVFGKFSAILQKDPLFNLNNLRKIQGGIAFNYHLGSGSFLAVGFDITQHFLVFSESTVRNRSLGLGISYNP